MNSTKIIVIFFAAFLLFELVGCDSGSPSARLVTETSIELYKASGEDIEELPDFWITDNTQRGCIITEIGSAFKFLLGSDMDASDLRGIKVKCEVTGHGGFEEKRDISDELSVSGEKFLNHVAYPGPGWKTADHDKPVSARTTDGGKALYVINLGDPSGFGKGDPPPFNLGWKLPGPGGSYNDTFGFWVESKITVPRTGEQLDPVYCWAFFSRGIDQCFWFPEGYGVYSSCISGIGHWPGSLGGTAMGDKSAESLTSEPGPLKLVSNTLEEAETEFNELARGIPVESLPVLEETPETSKTSILASMFAQNIGKQASQLFMADSQVQDGFYCEYIGGAWFRYVFAPDIGRWVWEYAPEHTPLLWLSGDSNDPNDGMDLVSMAEPYMFYCRVCVHMPDIEQRLNSFNSFSSTVLLASKDDALTVFVMPVKMYVHQVNILDVNTADIFIGTNLIIPMMYLNESGVYIDWWGYPNIGIYIPNGGYLEIRPVNELFGDFNLDGEINLKDLALLSSQWCRSLEEPNYDLWYDYDHDGGTGSEDLAAFAENWLCSINLIDIGSDFNSMENFNSYIDNSALRLIWDSYEDNGTKMSINVETDSSYVREGNSMRCSFDNTYFPYYAETSAYINDFPSQIGSNWEDYDILTLYFFGRTFNDANQIPYVKIIDGDEFGDFITIEDFNRYTSTSSMKNVWKDRTTNGTRANIYLYSGQIGDYPEFVRSGNSLQYRYTNGTPPYFAEAEATTSCLGISPDWLVNGAKTFTLYFYGQPANDTNETMYVKLTDSATPEHTSRVLYNGDTGKLKEKDWYAWDVNISQFTEDNPNFDLSKVAKVTIGFGDPCNPSPGGSGIVYFDDIRLYLQEPPHHQHIAQVMYDGDPNNLRAEEWKQWNIALSALQCLDVNTSNIERIAIGFGKKDPVDSSYCYVYIDDIRLRHLD
ncbi:MAG: hypothetical protein PHH54_06325 [Candidatus Nanoarchaeia archaeon]|nr:hypothetical protein [Candidatus Nanoarchaeia archaeon]